MQQTVLEPMLESPTYTHVQGELQCDVVVSESPEELEELLDFLELLSK
jgi:hypothetical protein